MTTPPETVSFEIAEVRHVQHGVVCHLIHKNSLPLCQALHVIDVALKRPSIRENNRVQQTMYVEPGLCPPLPRSLGC